MLKSHSVINCSENMMIFMLIKIIILRFSGTGNWIRLSREENKAVFQYEVKFEPQVDALKVRFHLLNTFKEQLGSAKTFDGSMLWLPVRLSKEVSFSYFVLIVYLNICNVCMYVFVVYECKRKGEKAKF